MSAAILQGVPATTLDTGLWIDLPERHYVRILKLCQKMGATILANTAVELTDGSVVNFLYRVDGLRSFEAELKGARYLKWLGMRVAVLGLQRIYRSKKVVGRPKDIAHLPLLKQGRALQKSPSRAVRLVSSIAPRVFEAFTPLQTARSLLRFTPC
jgi:hypothetical protein